jgi:hypothetical protein
MEEALPLKAAKTRTALSIITMFLAYMFLHFVYSLGMVAIAWVGARFDRSNTDGLVNLLLVLAVNFFAGLGSPLISFHFFPRAERSAAIYAFSTGIVIFTMLGMMVTWQNKEFQFLPEIIECVLAIAGAWMGKSLAPVK